MSQTFGPSFRTGAPGFDAQTPIACFERPRYLERAIDAILLTAESLATAAMPGLQEQLTGIQRVYVTRGGFSHEDIDTAGYRAFDAFRGQISRLADEAAATARLTAKMQDSRDAKYGVLHETHRAPVRKGPRWASLSLTSPAPANATIVTEIGLDVPRDADGDDDILVRNLSTNETLPIRVSEAHPELSTSATMRIRIFAERTVAGMLARLTEATREQLRNRGY